MKLLIISNMAHYQSRGEIVGWGPTVQEIDHLAGLFDEIVHVGCLHPNGVNVQSALPYTAPNVRFRPIPPAGGGSFLEKLRILLLFPLYARVILRELRQAEAVHVRCPANISMLAILLLPLVRRPAKRWIKYAGSWTAYEGESWSYAFQRWWLERGLARAEVTINGSWTDQPAHVHSFINPCLTDAELEKAQHASLGKTLADTVKLLFVGKLVETKGIFRVLEVVSILRDKGISMHLDVVGDGPDRPEVARRIADNKLSDQVSMHGWVPRTEIGAFYSSSHVLLLPSRAEGWPKVISEAMAYGVVPVAAAVGSIGQHLESFGVGRAVPYDNVQAFADAVAWYVDHPGAWKDEAARGMKEADRFSYRQYACAVRHLFERSGNGAVR